MFPTKNASLYHWMDRPNRENSDSIDLVKHLKISTNFWKNFFHQLLQPPKGVMQRGTETLKFFQDVNFEFIDCLQSNGTNYLVILTNLWRDLQFKSFVDIARAGRHSGSKTFWVKLSLFNQSKPGLEIELQILILFPWNLLVLWCKSVLSVLNWVSYQS